MNTPFAVFIVAQDERGLIAAITRAADRGEEGRIGLPGGKVDPGEHPVRAAVREAREEGWDVVLPLDATPYHRAEVAGEEVWWYLSDEPAIQLEDYKEKGRITPVRVPHSVIANSGYGNDWIRGLFV